MSNLIYPTNPPYATPNQVRQYVWSSAKQSALSQKTSRIAYQQYPIVHYELAYELLQDNTTPSDLKALVGLHNQLQGGWDSFLYQDPDFNSVAAQAFGTGDGSTTAFQLVATYQNAGGPGTPELIQNLNGTPSIYRSDWQGNQLLYSTARTNLLLQSQTLGTTWTDTGATISSNVLAAPDSTVTGDLIDETTATSLHSINQNVTVPATLNLPFTLSAWVQGATRTQCFLQLEENTGSTSVLQYFTLSGAGAVGATTTGSHWGTVSATIAAYAGGWYRVTLTATKTNAATSLTASIGGAVGGANSYTGVVGDGVYCWGAQLEQNSSATAYLVTVASTNTTTDYSLGVTGIVTFAVVPILAAALTWTGSFYYRCVFDDDKLDLKKFMNKWWAITKVPFTSIKL